MQLIQENIYKRFWLRKHYYMYAFIFISFILMAEKKFVGVPKKAILVVCFFVFLSIFFWNNKKIENNVFLLSLSFGFLFAVMSPIFDIWDEPAHMTRIEYISEGNLFLSNDKKTHIVSKDISFLEQKSRYTKRKTEILPNTLNSKLWTYKHNEEKEYQFRVPVTNAYGTISYIPSVVGYNIGKVISNNNLGVMFYLARIFNALFYSICAYIAVRISKNWKHIISFFALQPLAIYISGSLNQDAFSYGIILITCALFFNFIQSDKHELGFKQVNIYILICWLLAMTKLPYIVLAGLLFFIPYNYYKNKKVYIYMLFGIITVIFISFIWLTYYSKIEGLPPISKNVNSSGQIGYIINNIKKFLGVIFYNIYNVITKYGQLSSFAWDRQGSSVLGLVNLVFIGIILGFPIKGFEKISKWTKFGVCIISLIILFFVYLSMYLTWTDVGAPYISGVQGRYFFGVLLLTPIIFNYSKYVGKIEINRHTFLTPQIMSLILLVWSVASRVGIYY